MQSMMVKRVPLALLPVESLEFVDRHSPMPWLIVVLHRQQIPLLELAPQHLCALQLYRAHQVYNIWLVLMSVHPVVALVLTLDCQ